MLRRFAVGRRIGVRQATVFAYSEDLLRQVPPITFVESMRARRSLLSSCQDGKGAGHRLRVGMMVLVPLMRTMMMAVMVISPPTLNTSRRLQVPLQTACLLRAPLWMLPRPTALGRVELPCGCPGLCKSPTL